MTNASQRGSGTASIREPPIRLETRVKSGRTNSRSKGGQTPVSSTRRMAPPSLPDSAGGRRSRQKMR